MTRPISRIDLNLLGVFEAIYSRGGVTAAARHLHLTQSAISHSLAKLRVAFDDELFVRFGNAMVPTALARAIIGPVRDALGMVEQALVAAARFDPATTQRSFRIGLRQANEARFFADLVSRALAQAPGATLVSVNFRRSEIAAALAHGELDMAIDVPSAASEGLLAEPLRTDTMVVAARRGHPAVDGAIDLATYLACDHVHASPRSTGLGLEDQALATKGLSRTVRVRCQNIWSAWQTVARSDMILTLLDAHARALRPVADHQVLPLPFPIAAWPLQLLWHESAAQDPGNAWLRALVQETFAGSMP
ncbi:LysR family transcriptional regulator [Sphingomonas sp.]|jgi:DNA-binding transcriptional LysR family regulator|uniref:LysR family transcriptional regulator n=1 Tax=Sphingomonas sp. TaxID=28214 RepID=UPI00262F5A58|nr:LysR family transcriptional regulator [Sphingomonas sp.]MDF2605325.1 LysR family transcriptional regulator [Sphingomonas sp.]